ncbi:MAG: hypothetical protein K9M11_01470 [Candidatus Pacebacteria bacterium]|nr:hypothetical protein [Candidatus Paceibacterota bacterium]
MKLDILDPLIQRMKEILAELMQMRAVRAEQFVAEMEKIPLVTLKRISVQMGHTIPFCTVIEVNKAGTLADIIKSAGINIPVPQTAKYSYTVKAGDMSTETRIMQHLTTGGFLLYRYQIQILDELHPNPIHAVITEDGVVHRAGSVFISDFTEVRAYKGGPARKTPAASASDKEFTSVLFSSIWGPGTKVYMCIPDTSS